MQGEPSFAAGFSMIRGAGAVACSTTILPWRLTKPYAWGPCLVTQVDRGQASGGRCADNVEVWREAAAVLRMGPSEGRFH